jgi:hypothetical protein
LNPEVPADPQHRTSPFVSVIEMVVLLNVALIWAIARLTFFRIFFFLPSDFVCATPVHSPRRRCVPPDLDFA